MLEYHGITSAPENEILLLFYLFLIDWLIRFFIIDIFKVGAVVSWFQKSERASDGHWATIPKSDYSLNIYSRVLWFFPL